MEFIVSSSLASYARMLAYGARTSKVLPNGTFMICTVGQKVLSYLLESFERYVRFMSFGERNAVKSMRKFLSDRTTPSFPNDNCNYELGSRNLKAFLVFSNFICVNFI